MRIKYFTIKNIHKYRYIANLVNYLLNKMVLLSCLKRNCKNNRGKKYPEIILDNNLYGIADVLLNYSKYTKSHIPYIEHGMFFGNHLQHDEISCYPNKIVTMSKKRKALIESQCTKEAVPVGPYIRYVSINDEKIKKLKKRLGSVVVHFPIKSTKSRKSSVSMDWSLHHQIHDKYDTKIACFYYLDLKDEICKEYKSRGYKIVCAGDKWSRLFLYKLAKIIRLSDFTTSDVVGTHVGYCYALGKEHVIFNKWNEYNHIIRGGEKIYKEYQMSANSDRVEIENAFIHGNYSACEQKLIAEKYWGNDIYLTPSTMAEKLNS